MRASPAVLALAFGMVSGFVRADDKLVCFSSHADAQVLRKARHLRAARQDLKMCSSHACPDLVAKDCTQWLAELDEQQPSIVVAAKDERQRDLLDVETAIDGTVAARKLDGGPLEVDPGEHHLRASLPDGRVVTKTFIARESEHARLIEVAFPAPVSTASPATLPRSRRVPLATWLLAGLGAAATVPWVVFGVEGFIYRGQLDLTCQGTCTADQVSTLHRDFVVADILGGVAIASVSTAVLIGILARLRPTVSVEVAPAVGTAHEGLGMTRGVIMTGHF
jgi:hypothetical protein